MAPPDSILTAAMIHEVFHGPDAGSRLVGELERARELGAELAVLPELPVDPWVPAGRRVRDEDAEPPGGPRQRLLAGAARTAAIAVAGGAIVRDEATGRRLNRALLFDGQGSLRATYDKLHLPSEEGFWESDHYEPGQTPPRRIDGLALPIGIQICSDMQRPQGCQILGALGVAVILAPRATPAASYERWLTVLRANAITSATYVLSVNRPRSEGAASIGGPSVAIAPDGRVIVESTETRALVRLEQAEVKQARGAYPGYLDLRPDVYSRAWSALSNDDSGAGS